ncbi:Conserved_hypothetical protein [Hexamita inflata]|uniref:MORN repeat protein n=1 Tax=Hexamita inflata TaxID=28002 RepID=A0AA86UWT2_9EUKA|nr:Conserved hypothetical protein [Hexamita inflata]
MRTNLTASLISQEHQFSTPQYQGAYNHVFGRSSTGTQQFENGDKFTGTFENNLPLNGVYEFADGSKYSGEFTDGQITGSGTLTLKSANGFTVYEGSFVNGRPDSKITAKFVNQTFTGEYKEGQKIRGELTQSNNVYNGEFLNNRFNGEGAFTSEQMNYKGAFENGMRNGKGTEIGADFQFKGQFKNDFPEGKGMFKTDKGEKKGMWTEGVLQ